jgi:hypothetical protein
MVKIEFKTGNSTFSDEAKELEIARILKKIAYQIATGYDNDKIRDINGNTIGSWEITEERQ